MMNPGWKQPDDLHPFVANLTEDPSVGLADYIVKERIFNFFLYQGKDHPKNSQTELIFATKSIHTG